MQQFSFIGLAALVSYISLSAASSIHWKFYDDGNCQGNIQDEIDWNDTDGVHNVVLIGAGRIGAVSVYVECISSNGDDDDCNTIYYGGQYGTGDILGYYYGLGCVSTSEFIESAAMMVPGIPLPGENSMRRRSHARDIVKREQDTSPYQRGVFDWDPTYRVEWDPVQQGGSNTCPATTLEMDEALSHISQQFQFDGSSIAQAGTIQHFGDIYEDFSGNPLHTLTEEFTVFQPTAYHEAGIWHGILDTLWSRLYRNGGINHLAGITLFLYANGGHVASATYQIRANN